MTFLETQTKCLLYRHLLWLTVILFCNSVNLYSQHNVRLYIGGLYYHGDLTENIISSKANTGIGVSFSKEINHWVELSGRFIYGTVSGSDQSSYNVAYRNRNLSFSSDIYELSAVAGININQLFWQSLDKYNLRLFINGGVAFFHFNPKTLLNDKWIALNPVGTEGQNMEMYKENRYSLYQWSIPVGLMVEFDLYKQYKMGLEVSPRITFTDYLDDVSTFYINRDEMLASGNELGALLSNRQGELLDQNVNVETGTKRGDNNKTDWYSFLSVYLRYSFPVKKLED
jgi:hypothetical protein